MKDRCESDYDTNKLLPGNCNFVRVRFLQQTNSTNKITVIAAIGKNTLDINYIHLADPAQNSTQFEHNDDHNNGCKILIIVITNIHMYLRTFCKRHIYDKSKVCSFKDLIILIM